jgi:hypothetical protein
MRITLNKLKPIGDTKHSNRFPEKLPTQKRYLDAQVSVTNEVDTVEEEGVLYFTISSEAPYERWYGLETLSHSPEAIDLSRLNNGAMFFWNHHPDIYLGKILRAWIANSQIVIKVLFALDDPEINQKYLHCKSGFLTKTSVGYQIQEMELVESTEDIDSYLVTKWQPYEGSLVTIPADDSVGSIEKEYQKFLRCDASELRSVKITNKKTGGIMKTKITDDLTQDNTRSMNEENAMCDEGSKMDDEKEGTMCKDDEDPMAQMTAKLGAMAAQIESLMAMQPAAKSLTPVVPVENPNEDEFTRQQEIKAMGKKFENPELADKLCADRTSIKEARATFAGYESAKKSQKPIAMPNVNTLLSPNRDRTDGLVREWEQAIDSCPKAYYVKKSTGENFIQRDWTEAKRFFHANRSELRVALERQAREFGLLQGNTQPVQGSERASTLKTDIAPALLDYLSMFMRETHTQRYVFWQFPFYNLELGRGPGDVIQVPRLRWLAEASSVADRTLTPGTSLNTARQNLAINSVSITLGERGLGKAGLAGAEPVGIPEFVAATSMINLENAVRKVLGHDYEAYVDLSIRSRMDATTAIIYNNGGQIETSVGNLNTASGGTMTEAFLNNLYSHIAGTRSVPTFDDGSIGLVLSSKPLAQLKNSLAARNQYIEKTSMEELTNIMSVGTNQEFATVSGYVGKFCGFQIFSSNAFSEGAATTEGVQSQTTGAGARLTRTSYAFGCNAIARAVGMEAEIRASEVTEFKRLQSYIWVSHETTADLDVDAGINAEQQTRVFDIRTLDVAL